MACRTRIAGIIATSRIAMTAKEEPMGFVTLEDEHGLFGAALFPQVFRELSVGRTTQGIKADSPLARRRPGG